MINELPTETKRGVSTAGNVIVGSLAAFGIIVSSAVLSVVVAGLLQWRSSFPDFIDDGLPLLVIAAGMVMAGRVAADVAARHAIWCAVGASLLTAAVGMVVEATTAAHGDALEPPQVAIAAVVVLLITGASAWAVQHRRRAHTQRLLSTAGP